ncbi:alpha/beta fold hydrolase [Dechloromonas denitrificans]|uniref:alpha/beta fold hydrolase n=1 Tax=Dechloromonas denitrificans TaxID=281362 RepID=UPI001CFB5253|nr:alpha/beta hydrolase [Dechloromonas denitrificans]UCV05942.1 alpha/beta hydrolase [Dechloromonas denitrificans]
MEINVLGQLAYIYNGGKKLTADAVRQQPVVVFIHGAQQDHSCWVLQSRWFAHHGFSVLVPDLPGHGRSAGEALPSVEVLADWIVALLDALGVEKASLIGHSMGSLVALEATVRHAGRVSQTALIGTSLPMPVSQALLDATRDNEPKAVAMINAFSYSATGQIGGNTVPGLWLLGMNQRLMERQKKGVFHTDMNACNAYARSPDSLKEIATPLLIVAGSQDRMTSPKAAKALLGFIPGARLVSIEGSGHALMAERPDAVLDTLRGFIAGG